MQENNSEQKKKEKKKNKMREKACDSLCLDIWKFMSTEIIQNMDASKKLCKAIGTMSRYS